MNKDKLVMPGDQLSSSEELLPGNGTFEENGVIRAARIGTYIVDKKNRRAVVKPATSTPVVLKKGDVVLAKVTAVRPIMVIADVFHVIGKNRGISGDNNGTLHASEISFSYVKDSMTEYRVGDIIRAKIIQVKPSIQLSTKDRNLGAIKALCVKCRQSLIKKGNMLRCEHCGNQEKRKTAFDYGDIDIDKL
jgi:exosome complex component CSL4